MDIEYELPDQLCSQNLYFLDDEEAQKISDLIKKLVQHQLSIKQGVIMTAQILRCGEGI